MNLQLFAEMNTNLTTSAGLSEEMKTFYSDYLIDNATPKLVHDQFGQKHPIPKNGGKTIQFRKYSPLPKLTTPIAEGVTPNGQSLNMSVIEATVAQYGGYITLSDVLLLTAIDNNLVQATKLLGAQAGSTLDTITRDVLNGGTNVIYSGGKNARTELDADSLLKVDDIKKAVRLLKNQNAEPINASWVGIIHPDIAYDLTNDPAWKDVKTYSDPSDIYEGEIGKLYGVRFVETTEAKIFAKAGASNQAVYSTLILGDNAYGVTEVSGGGLQHIVKQLGSAGTGDPLDQRATAGWKAIKVAERLVETYMVRIESGSTFNPDKDN
jgi:N4-gp56 family major capsid protein